MITDLHGPDDIIAFWFKECERRMWFQATPAFDQALTERFGVTHEAASRGDIDFWAEEPAGTLALLIVLDQFTRVIHRGTPLAFAQDAKALVLAREGLARGHDRQIEDPDWRQFHYIPFTHHENLAVQEEGVALMAERLSGHEALRYARAHRDVIARFGRFPHRNSILGRMSSPAEQAYLDAGGGFR